MTKNHGAIVFWYGFEESGRRVTIDLCTASCPSQSFAKLYI